MNKRKAVAMALLTVLLSAAPVGSALANGGHGHSYYYGNPFYPIVGLAAAVVGTAAAIVTLPFAALAAVAQAPYYAPPQAFAPGYGAAPAYAPPAAPYYAPPAPSYYYAPPAVYVAPRPVAYAGYGPKGGYDRPHPGRYGPPQTGYAPPNPRYAPQGPYNGYRAGP